ncbi:invertebrate-type lysozyme 3-like [Lycorma delicatula]|uniref:invertebrate-type lysozyme 3-like n=1 Tax=Lycorma delicatula TaxID=130591 RepID=UPI003F51713C
MYNLQSISTVTIITAATIIAVTSIDRNSVGIVCLKCLCESVSNCNASFGCDSNNICGPYQITEPFWIDGDKPLVESDDVENPGAFSRCTADPTCATRTVYNYMNKFKQDCNDDGDVDCLDIGHIHKYGLQKSACSHKLVDTFKDRICSCLRENEAPENVPIGCRHK